MRKGAIAPWAKSSSPYYLQTLEALARHYKFSLNEPWEDLPKKARDVILHGSGEDEIKFIYDDGMRRYETKKAFEGVIPNMERRYQGNRFLLGARRAGALPGRSRPAMSARAIA